jgi:hypothetical protein
MYLQMRRRSRAEDVSTGQTEPGLYGGWKSIATAQHGIPNEDCARVVEEGDPVTEAGRLHTGQSIRLREYKL